MGAPAGPAPESKNQDQTVAVVLEVLRMPPPAVKILASRAGLLSKKSGKIQSFAVAVVLFGNQKV